ncbi:MAG: nucleoside 2-deoxyribosyltransferase [Lachnospiraceae bacterium]
MKKCFIVCPIGNENSDTRKRSDLLFKYVISPVCENTRFEPIRIDKESTNGSLTDEILQHLKQDDLVIADLTESNPNAFYEIGYRAALGKPSIHLISKDAKIPFDVSTIRSYSYDLTNLESVDEVKTRIIQTINSLKFEQSSLDTNSTAQTASDTLVTAQLLQEIYKIQDSIAKLTETIDAKDTATVSILADKLANINQKTADAILVETLLPKFFENPDQLLKVLEVANKFPSKK